MIVNGQPVHLTQAQEGKRLLDLLRDDLGLTGAKEGCGMGECGSCAVQVDGAAMCSCLILAGQVAGSQIITAEGLDEAGDGDLQDAFVAHQAVQCGYCIPGVLAGCSALLRANPSPTGEDVEHALEGNLCRCTGYNRFTDAVLEVASRRREQR